MIGADERGKAFAETVLWNQKLIDAWEYEYHGLIKSNGYNLQK